MVKTPLFYHVIRWNLEKPAPTSSPRAWLEHFPTHRRSGVANLFHMSVRGGARTPATILEGVRGAIARHLDWPDPLAQAHFQSVREALHDDEAGARLYAQHVLDYERMPHEQRKQVKAERSIAYLKQAMASKSVTPAQLSLLQALGYTGQEPANRAEASALIDQLRQKGGAR